MDFLDKLYESEFFGIGLFIVISFLVVLFLIVLFFGKKDEKKRKMASGEEASAPVTNNNEMTFKETGEPITLDVPVNNLETVEPIQPINYDIPIDNISMNEPVAPISPEPVQPVVDNQFAFEPVSEIPVNNNFASSAVEAIPEVKAVIPQPVATPEVSPIIEPARATSVPNVAFTEPIIKEEPTLINIPVQEVPKVAPVFEQPVEPVVKEEPVMPEVRNTSIDFDALASSISKELDALEQSVKVTPLEEAIKPTNQFSSVYVSTPVEPVGEQRPTPTIDVKPEPTVVEPTRIDVAPKSGGIELPKKVEMPAVKSSEPINIQVNDIAEPESYNI